MKGFDMGRQGKRWRLIGIVLSVFWLIGWFTYEWGSRMALIARQMGTCIEEDSCTKVEELFSWSLAGTSVLRALVPLAIVWVAAWIAYRLDRGPEERLP